MLEKERKEIDAIDKELIALLEKRWDLILKVAMKKKQANIPVLDEEREKRILEKVAMQVEKKEYAPSIQQVYKAMFELSRSYQQTKLND